jgi:hypothetical protein
MAVEIWSMKMAPKLQTDCPTKAMTHKINPFDFVKSASYTKQDIMVDDVTEKAYQPFLVNKSFSYHRDTIYFAEEMNCSHHLANRLQYSFYLNTLRRKQRFSKWSKPYVSKKIEVIKNFYGVSSSKAKEYLDFLTDKQINILKKKMNQGGTDHG